MSSVDSGLAEEGQSRGHCNLLSLMGISVGRLAGEGALFLWG
jgi:hypothetical protein